MWPANWLAGLTTAWKIDSKQKVTIYWPCQKIMSAEIHINEEVNMGRSIYKKKLSKNNENNPNTTKCVENEGQT